MVLVVFVAAIFVSALLLFQVQPMFAMMALPLLGGSAAVWNTALVFYQLVLLAGYIYAHAVARMRPRRQVALHAAVLLVPLLVLPLAIPEGWTPPTTTTPILWLLGLLAVVVGPPFFAVTTTSPLLQSWFARTRHRAAADPYFLYAASNVGSLLGLLSYPFVIQPQLRLGTQALVWSIGYGVFVAAIGACMLFVWRSAATAGAGDGAACAGCCWRWRRRA